MIKIKKKWKHFFYGCFGTLSMVFGLIFLIEWVLTLIFGEM